MKHCSLFLVFGLLIVLIGCSTTTGEDLEVKGSDTMVQLVSSMAESFGIENTGARIAVTGGGTGTGIAALISGEIEIADASRPMSAEEIESAKRNGFTPVPFVVAHDMLSMIVHSENNVRTLSIDEIGRIYRGEVKNWNELGGRSSPITLYGRQSSSGTYGFFMEEVVRGEYDQTMRMMEGNQAILDAVSADHGGIGYVGIGYLISQKRESIHGLSIKRNESSPSLSPYNSSDHKLYPISRPLYQYLRSIPSNNSAIQKFLLYEISEKGQEIVREAGYIPLSEVDRAKNKMMIGLR